MQLSDVIEQARAAVDIEVRGGSAAGIDVTHITHDSHAVQSGSLFCAVPGRRHDGHQFVGEAVAAGAVAAVVQRDVEAPVPRLLTGDVRRAMGPLASSVYAHPSRSLAVVGVTGTNGKTSTVHLLGAIFTHAGWPTEVIGTLTGVRTTPEAPDLQLLLAAARDRGAVAAAIEVSSHALAQHRVDGTRFAAAVFTNLSPDHLDFHGSMEEYFRAKARLFEPAFTDVAIIDVSTTYGGLLARSAPVATVVPSGLSTVEVVEATLSHSTFRWRGRTIRLPLGGRFNVTNAVLAGDTAVALGVDDAVVADALAAAPGVPGRFELIDAGQPFAVVVDYAHTPDGLTNVLRSAREAARGRVIVVFGCGGDRDTAKRPLMGRAAEQGADVVVVTSDNPRHEDPRSIIDAVVAGMAQPPAAIVVDRRAAIATALARAGADDVVVIAGKGHETTQQIGDRFVPFDDRAFALEWLQRAGYGGRA